MNMSFALLITGLGFATLCDAHAHLKDSQPADGSVVTIAPDNLVLRFSEAARVTALALHRVGEAERKLVPLPTAPAQQVTLPLSKLGPGKYVVTYRVVSGDGHIMSGELRFTIDPSARPTASKASRDQTP
ncbi:MAG: copper resistance protein CopC [Gammaproteobacteria bacterium]|nr:MAG: copper resistance protein CopC [Gammaproteobacteria bacterium]